MKHPEFHIIIPARYQSTRFPGKLLMDLNGQTVLERVYRQALKAKPQSLIIATDNELIYQHMTQLGADVQMTASTHETGSDRLAEVIKLRGFDQQDIIVNVQGDEPLIAPELIIQVAQLLEDSSAPIATLCWPIDSLEALSNPNVVKVVKDSKDYALYFSRAAIPAHRDDATSFAHSFRHIGLYAYRAGYVLTFVQQSGCPLEQCESLEQLRALWMGEKIKLAVACAEPCQDINTPEDLARAIASTN